MILSQTDNFSKRKDILHINAYIFSFMFFLSALYYADNSFLKSIGIISIIILLLLSIVGIFNKKREIFNNCLDLMCIAVIYITFLFINMHNISSLYKVIMQLALYLFIISLSINVLYPKTQEKIVNIFSRLFVIISIFLFILQQLDFFSSNGEVEFSFGSSFKALFACSFFLLYKLKRMWAAVILCAFLNILIGERTAALVLIIVFGFYKILGILSSKVAYKLLFLIVVLFCLSFPFIYIGLKYSDYYSFLQELSWKYTNANFFSGREMIWEAIFLSTKNSIWFGLGIDMDLYSIINENLSTHNLYVFIFSTAGIIGLFLFIYFCYRLWLRFLDHMYDRFVRLSAAYFLGILLFCDFELIMLINNIVISLFFWFVIGVGIMRCNYLKIKNG